MVPKDEGNHIATTGVTSLTDDWDKAWGSDEEDPSSNESRHRDSINEDRRASQVDLSNTASSVVAPVVDTGDDVLDAWNWGDEDDATEETAVSSLQLSFWVWCSF